MGIIVEDVELFKDLDFSETWTEPMFNPNGYTIELKDGKGRVYSNTPHKDKTKNISSRFNKLKSIGGIVDTKRNIKFYALTVNGNSVFFKIDTNKFKPKK